MKTKNRRFLNTFWNMNGSILNALSTMIFTICTIRISGDYYGGIVGLAIGIAFIFSSIGYFEIRPFQSTDIHMQYSFSCYFTHRIATCVLMLFLFTAYSLVVYGFTEKSIIIICFCFFKLIDCFSDVFHGLFQQKDCLYLAGLSLSIRLLLSIFLFIAALVLTDNIIFSIIMMILISLFHLFFFDIKNAKIYTTCKLSTSKESLLDLTKKCFPLFITSFIAMYIANIGKISVDTFYPNLQAEWNAIFILSSIINLFSIFAFRPLLTQMTRDWTSGDKSTFSKTWFLLVIWISFITIIALLISGSYGIQVLSLIYGLPLKHYRLELLFIICGGGFNAASVLLYYISTIMRIQKKTMLSDIIVFFFATFLTFYCTKKYSLLGAALAYLFTMLLRSFLLSYISIKNYKSHKSLMTN